jgi:cytochrome b
MSTNEEKITVWDLPTRAFHWTLVLSFVLAYLSGEYHIGFVHTLIGYFLCALVLFRFVWGFSGNRYARFSSFVFSPQETLEYLRSMLKNRPKHYFGHNPAGALMVFALLGVLALIFLTGLLTLGTIDYEGPFAFLANGVDDETSYMLHDMHGWLIDFALILVPLHLLGVAAGSIQHKENLVRAMVTGKKNPPEH